MAKPKPIIHKRIRNIRQYTFGWIDHNFLHKGFLNRLSPEELLLYYFLITVSDRNGVSFYDYERICQFLKLELDDYLKARDLLCDRSLIAQKDGVFQVLSLPEPEKETIEKPPFVNRSSANDAQTLKQIFQQFAG